MAWVQEVHASMALIAAMLGYPPRLEFRYSDHKSVCGRRGIASTVCLPTTGTVVAGHAREDDREVNCPDCLAAMREARATGAQVAA